jgi:chromosome segregation ATPase
MSEQDQQVDAAPAASSESEVERVREIILGTADEMGGQRIAESDRLREVIFGPQMRLYERRFSDIQKDNERVSRDLRSVIDRVGEQEDVLARKHDSLSKDLQQNTHDVRQEIDQLVRSVKVMKDVLVEQFAALERKSEAIRQAHEQTDGKLDQEVNRLNRELRHLQATVSERDSFHDKLEGLRQETRRAEDEVHSELRRLTDRLSSQKMDRRELAAMFLETAARLETGGSVTSWLDELPSGD